MTDAIERYVTALHRSTLTPSPSPGGRGERFAKPRGFVIVTELYITTSQRSILTLAIFPGDKRSAATSLRTGVERNQPVAGFCNV